MKRVAISWGRAMYLPSQVLRWAYTKDKRQSAGLDRGWVDQVEFGPLAPMILRQPVNQMADLGASVVFENMDIQKVFGRTVSDLIEAFARFPDAAFCLDVAHVCANDPTLILEP